MQQHALVGCADAEHGAGFVRAEAVDIAEEQHAPVMDRQGIDFPQDEPTGLFREQMSFRAALHIGERVRPVP